ncbi:type II secretion system protein GspJ [Roseivivax marinus]|uniref:type II secretion system protein GspJ n=1 Tax=Roseivivax marinus TaxID=1379903 RepID=UPI00273EFD73|nr:type II secretion system protein GspJ [Roseivivax marinus]
MIRSGSSRTTGTDRGLTLIELVVAMGVFALVATMGLQALTGTLRARDRITEAAEGTERLAVATSLLRADLERLVPLLDRPADGGARSAIAWDNGALGLSLAGVPRIGGADVPGFARVRWSVAADGTLMRAQRATLFPAQPGEATGMPLLDEVRRLELRTYWRDLGWVDGTVNGIGVRMPGPVAPTGDGDDAGRAIERFSDTLPAGIEVTVVRTDGTRIPILEAVQ